MASNETLSKTAYGGVDGTKYVPHVKNKSGISELKISTIFLGILMSVLFAGANTYLGLTAGITIAAGIPSAILGGGLLVAIFRRKSILEGNMIQSMASAGESIASGVIFVLPAIIITGAVFDPFQAIVAALVGMLLGSAVMLLVRKYLIIQSHGDLLYPESMAISEVLVASDAQGEGLKILAIGGAIGGLVKSLGSEVFAFFNSAPTVVISSMKAQLGVAVAPALVGVGYIVGIEVGLAMVAGTVLANFAMIPLFGFFGALTPDLIVFPSTVPLSEMSPSAIGSKYTRYIGAGAIATGGLITIVKIMPTVFVSIKKTLSNISVTTSDNYDPDLSLKLAIAMAIFSFVVVAIIPGQLFVGLIAATLVVVCSVLFAIVGARMTGIIGTSNLPVSGMTIASLLVITPAFVLLGHKDINAIGIIVLLGTTVVTAISLTAGFSQSLKATFIIGGTTKQVQKMYMLSAVVGVLVVVGLIYVLEQAYGFSKEGSILIAPQANLVSMIITGITDGNLPWVFILSGVAIAIALALLKLPIMSIAIGFYLPITTVFAVFIGGLLRVIVERKYKNDPTMLDNKITKGTILAAGLVAGEALIGLFAAIIAVAMGNVELMNKVGSKLIGENISTSITVGILALIVLLIIVYKIIVKNNTKTQ